MKNHFTGFRLLRNGILTAVITATGALPVVGLANEDWEQARQVMQKYCLECHGGDSIKGDLDYSTMLHDENTFRADLDALEAMEFMVAENEMPPPDAKAQPSAAERKALLSWNLKLIDEAAHAIPQDPGVVVMPRHTRDSYNRALSQLAGIEIEPGEVLALEAPAGEGFTNVGEAHTMEPSQLEKYLMAATKAVSYVRVSPVRGLIWGPKPDNLISSPEEARAYYMDEHLKWHDEIFRYYAAAPDQWFNKHGIGHGEYWFQLWRWQHRDALGLNAQELGELVVDSEFPLNPVVLGRWQQFFEAEKEFGTILEELRAEWRALPAPGSAKPEGVREKISKIEAWYREYNDHHTREPNIELVSNKVFGGSEIRELNKKGIHRMRYDFSKFKEGQSHEKLYLTLTDRLDGHEDDVVRLENGFVLYGDNVAKKPEKRVPWHEVDGVKWTDKQGRPLTDSPDVQAQAVGEGALEIKAPAVAVLHLPKDAKGLDMDFVMDEEKYPNASVQHWLDAEIPKTLSPEFGEEPTPDHYIHRRRGISSPSAGRMASQAVDERLELFMRAKFYGKHPDYFLNGYQELDPYYEKVDTRRDGPNSNNPGEPYELGLEDFLASLSDEQREARRKNLEELEYIAQMPHHDLVELLVKNNLDLVEGVRPTEEQLAKLSDEDRQKAVELIEQANKLDMELWEIAKPMVREFATRAWRRQVSDEELENLMEFYVDARLTGSPFGASVKQSLRAVLCSPHFLYRYQVAENSEEPYPIDARGLADRLAAVLWDGIPDEELLSKVEDGSITKPEVLAEQARRMLKDEKAASLGSKFGAEWIGYKHFRNHVDPDPDRFKDYSEEIAYAMEQEASHFFSYLLREDRPVTDLYSAPYTFVNEKLANFYDLDVDAKEDEFVKVELPERRRGGVLTLGSFLTKTSMPLRTSAVVRGTWIIEKILGEHLPDPPPNVPQLSDDETNSEGLSVAQQLARHRDDPACMGCHQKIDPMGIALENFDPVGQWRSEFVNGMPVEAADKTADGTELDGLQDLTAYLDSRRDEIVEQLSRMFIAYALGRELQPSDRPLVDEMVKAMEANDYRFAPALEVLVASKQFRYRRDSLDYAMN